MKYWFLGCALVLTSYPAAAQRRSVPRGSFISRPAHSTQELLQQFDTNPEVRNRYTKIFGRSTEETREILSRLQPKELLETHRLPIGYYNGSGVWTYHEDYMQKGSLVFVTPEGVPFLKAKCGNPIVAANPYPRVKAAVSRPPVVVPPSLEVPPVPLAELMPAPAPEEFGEALPPAFEYLTTPTTELAEIFPPEMEFGLPPESSPELLAPPGLPGSSFNPFWLALLAPLGFLGHGHDHDHPPPPPPPPPPGVVPEASTWAIFGAGAAALWLLSRRPPKVRAS